MINVIVSYTVKPEFAEENKRNIQIFLSDFKRLDHTQFIYTVYVKSDGITFVHSSNYIDEKTQQAILQVPSFLQFQKRRDESGLNDSHAVEVMECIGSSKAIL